MQVTRTTGPRCGCVKDIKGEVVRPVNKGVCWEGPEFAKVDGAAGYYCIIPLVGGWRGKEERSKGTNEFGRIFTSLVV